MPARRWRRRQHGFVAAAGATNAEPRDGNARRAQPAHGALVEKAPARLRGGRGLWRGGGPRARRGRVRTRGQPRRQAGGCWSPPAAASDIGGRVWGRRRGGRAAAVVSPPGRGREVGGREAGGVGAVGSWRRRGFLDGGGALVVGLPVLVVSRLLRRGGGGGGECGRGKDAAVIDTLWGRREGGWVAEGRDRSCVSGRVFGCASPAEHSALRGCVST